MRRCKRRINVAGSQGEWPACPVGQCCNADGRHVDRHDVVARRVWSVIGSHDYAIFYSNVVTTQLRYFILERKHAIVRCQLLLISLRDYMYLQIARY